MADPNSSLDQSRLRSRGGCLFLGLPLVLVPIVIFGYAGIWGMGLRGRAPTGDRVEMQYAGCPEAEAVVLARVAHMGLGEPTSAATEGGFTVTARMPEDARVAANIPRDLTEVGDFALYYGDKAEALAGADDVVKVFPRMTGDASATSVVVLTPALGGTIQRRQMDDPEGHLEVWIDDVHVVDLRNDGPLTGAEVEIEPEPEETRAAIERAASRAIALANPLPCQIELVGTQVVAD